MVEITSKIELARQNFVAPRGRGGKRPTDSRRAHNIRRADSMRVSRGRESMRPISEALDPKLGVGLKEVEDALNQIEANKTIKAVTLLVENLPPLVGRRQRKLTLVR